MADKTEDETKISIKVLVQKKENRVIYAEADHKFVDILFSFMTLPLGTIVRLLQKQFGKKSEALGSVKNLYQSLVDLPECYLSTEECKYMLLNPRSPSFDRCKNLKLKIDDTEDKQYFVCKRQECTSVHCAYSIFRNARCSYCGDLMDQTISCKDSAVCDDYIRDGGGVFVSDIASYLVTDNLCVIPYTPGCCIQLLKDLGITDTSDLEERTYDVGCQQMVHLLRLGLSCNSALTCLFLQTDRPICGSLGQFSFDLNKIRGSTSSYVSLYVSIQKSSGKLLFAEAEADFVDLVFAFLGMPLGGVCSFLNHDTSLVCVDNIYKSISNSIMGNYLRSKDIKETLLEPQFGQEFPSRNKIILWGEVFLYSFDMSFLPSGRGSYILSRDGHYRANFKDPRISEKLFKQFGMFVVTDDLVISPSSSVSTMDILHKLKVPVSDIERHSVNFGLDELLRLLKASLSSFSALTISLEHQMKKLN